MEFFVLCQATVHDFLEGYGDSLEPDGEVVSPMTIDDEDDAVSGTPVGTEGSLVEEDDVTSRPEKRARTG